jgi:hypothetical protein
MKLMPDDRMLVGYQSVADRRVISGRRRVATATAAAPGTTAAPAATPATAGQQQVCECEQNPQSSECQFHALTLPEVTADPAICR